MITSALKGVYLLLVFFSVTLGLDPFDLQEYSVVQKTDDDTPLDFQMMIDRSESIREIKRMDERERVNKMTELARRNSFDSELLVIVFGIFLICGIIAVMVVCYCIRFRKEVRILESRNRRAQTKTTTESSGVILTYIEQRMENGQVASNETVTIEMDSLLLVSHL